MQWEAHSKPLAVDDPLLLPEQEVHAEININWVLDQEIPKGGYVRILAESLLSEERLGKTKIRTTEGLTTSMEPHRGWTIDLLIDRHDFSYLLHQHCRVTSLRIIQSPCISWIGRVHLLPLAGSSTIVHSSLILQNDPPCYVC